MLKMLFCIFQVPRQHRHGMVRPVPRIPCGRWMRYRRQLAVAETCQLAGRWWRDWGAPLWISSIRLLKSCMSRWRRNLTSAQSCGSFWHRRARRALRTSHWGCPTMRISCSPTPPTRLPSLRARRLASRKTRASLSNRPSRGPGPSPLCSLIPTPSPQQPQSTSTDDPDSSCREGGGQKPQRDAILKQLLSQDDEEEQDEEDMPSPGNQASTNKSSGPTPSQADTETDKADNEAEAKRMDNKLLKVGPTLSQTNSKGTTEGTTCLLCR